MTSGLHVTIDQLHHAGYECVRLRTGALEIVATCSAGPRIIGLWRPRGTNLLAVLPDAVIDRPSKRPFRFIGGHRLWAAPEVPDITYASDDVPIGVTIDETSVTLSAPADEAGLQKTMAVGLEPDQVVIEHIIANHGEKRQIAPWAITQLVPGGTALLPLGALEPDEYQADASVIAWPYSDWSDPAVRIERDRIEIEASRTDPTKFGTALRRRWMAYKLDENLFVKRPASTPGPYADLGATGQCYATRTFLELETLGTLQMLRSGDSVRHKETWELHHVDSSASVAELAAELDLDGTKR